MRKHTGTLRLLNDDDDDDDDDVDYDHENHDNAPWFSGPVLFTFSVVFTFWRSRFVTFGGSALSH